MTNYKHTTTIYFDSEGNKITVTPEDKEQVRAFKESNAPFVQGDEIPPTESYASPEGLIFTSKSALRAHYKEHGFEDTGGSHIKSDRERQAALKELKKQHRADLETDVQMSINKLKYGMAPLTEKDKEICKREARGERLPPELLTNLDKLKQTYSR